MKFPHQVVAITGASSGIGAELAVQLGALGCSVGLIARREDLLKEVAAKVVAAGGKACCATADVADIDALLDEWNAMVGPPRLPTSPASPACDGSGGVDSVSGTTAGADEPGSSGCGCRSRGPAAPGGMALLGLALLGLRRRRGGPGVSSRSS